MMPSRSVLLGASIAAIIVIGFLVWARFAFVPSPVPSRDAARERDAPRAYEVADPGSAQPAVEPVTAGDEHPAPPVNCDCSIRGEVRDRRGGPVAGASVLVLPPPRTRERAALMAEPWLTGTGPYRRWADPWRVEREAVQTYEDASRATSDEEGRYELRGAPCSARAVTVIRQGYVPLEGLPVALVPGETVRRDFVLDRGGTLGGRVLDESGQPLAGASVAARPSRVEAARGFGRFLAESRRLTAGSLPPRWLERATDSEGRFQLLGLAAEDHDVIASAQGFAEARLESVAPDALDLQVTLDRGGRIVGSVALDDGAALDVDVDLVECPLAAERIGSGRVEFDLPEGGRTIRSLTVRAPGPLEVQGVGPGRFRLEFRGEGIQSSRTDPIEVVPGGSTDLGQVVLTADMPIEGTVRDAKGRPVGGALVRALRIGCGRDDWLGLTIASDAILEGRTEADGSYHLKGLLPGEYDMEVWSESHVPAVRRGVPYGATGVDFALEGGTCLRGVVRRLGTLEPVEAATVSFPPSSRGVSARDGSFEVRGLPAAGWLAEARPMFFVARAEGFRRKIGSVHFGAREVSGPLEILLEPLWTFRGTVRSPEGDPVAGARVRVEVPGAPRMLPGARGVAVTDALGRFQISVEDLNVRGAPRRPELFALHPAFAEGRSGPIDEAGDALEELEIVLGRGSAVRGIVCDGAGRGVAGARVELHHPPVTCEDAVLDMAFEARDPLRAARAGDDGSFVLERVPPGEYVLEAASAGFGMAVRIVGVVETQDLEIRVVLPDARVVSGRVVDTDGRSVRGAEVLALRRFFVPGSPPDAMALIYSNAPGIVRTRSEDGGDFVLGPLPEEGVTVAARKEGFEVAVADGVSSGGPDTLELVLVRHAGLSLEAVDGATQAPVSRYAFDLRLLAEDGGEAFGEVWNVRGFGSRVVSGAAGPVEIAPIPPARYRLSVTSADHVPASQDLRLDPGQRPEVRIVLSRGHVVTGVLTGANGAAVADAQVLVERVASPGTTETEGARRRGLSGADGRFEIRGIAAGTCYLGARHPAYLPFRGAPFDVPAQADRGFVVLEPAASGPTVRRSGPTEDEPPAGEEACR